MALPVLQATFELESKLPELGPYSALEGPLQVEDERLVLVAR